VESSIVLGIGNVLLSDDGAGVHAAQSLAQRLPESSGVRVIDAGTLSFTLLGYLEDADRLIIFDAGDFGAELGAVRCLECDALDAFIADGTRRRSVHEVGLADLLGMARLQQTLPPQRALFCIQAGDLGWGLEPSAPVRIGIQQAAEAALRLLERWQS
jgi:hydrogenase maturation protease